ncbi:hypothetical protein RRF57_003472 [Xylaria bambusicola]|uniref:Uncharacterized protein n=1 Tax=Xylaria bambusicola TaxID=326684 RepID=A0AAN7Z3G8_9PEZI
MSDYYVCAGARYVGYLPAQSIDDHEDEFIERRSGRRPVFKILILRKARQEGLIGEEARGEDQDSDR